MNAHPLVGIGKIPASSNAAALGLTKQAGITGKAEPAVGAGPLQPPAVQRLPMFDGATALTAVLPSGPTVGSTTPVPGPFASGYMLARGVLTLNRPPLTYRRHSML